MRCPVCTDVDLTMTDRQGVEIDYCPNCRGVWLDRGELDKIIERSAALTPERPEPVRDRPAERPRYEDRGERRYEGGYDDYARRKKKKGFLGELFDFD
ncbi:MAG: zf-TFIIB domain-containing protein [Armatimonadetes bacterium]|nr:zf-TFIIB domain-containing protein [Armatimonadota bacterium]